ncbi:MAG TPA: transposase [Draconibacterium sp.]|nr:transposase [Draconibacterium sp.]
MSKYIKTPSGNLYSVDNLCLINPQLFNGNDPYYIKKHRYLEKKYLSKNPLKIERIEVTSGCKSSPAGADLQSVPQPTRLKNNISKTMSRKYKFHNPEGVYFVSFAVQGWLDVFTRNEYKNILVDNLKYCQEQKGLEIFAWCIMTSHIHLIIRAGKDILLQDILRDYKKFTSKAIIKAIDENIQESRKEWLLKQFKIDGGNRFWRGDNKPVELWSNKVIDQKIDYIHMNPVEEGLVFRPEDYVYSSAADYAGEKGLLDVIVIK